MSLGIILNNFSVSKDRAYLWDIIVDTVNHYKTEIPDSAIISCSSGASPESDLPLDRSYFYRSGTRESEHNNPILMQKAIEDCSELKCEKILLVNPYYRVNNFDFLDSKLSLLIDKDEYPSDFIKKRSISFDFLHGSTDFINKAWSKHPWNYNIKNPSQNLFQKINNIVGSKKILENATFATKSDLSIEELKVFWKSNIKYTRH